MLTLLLQLIDLSSFQCLSIIQGQLQSLQGCWAGPVAAPILMYPCVDESHGPQVKPKGVLQGECSQHLLFCSHTRDQKVNLAQGRKGSGGSLREAVSLFNATYSIVSFHFIFYISSHLFSRHTTEEV